MANHYSNGIGGTTGDSLVLRAPLVASGTIWYVDSSTGDASYPGTDRKFPLATLGAAVTASSAGDIIVLLGTHAETTTAVITLSKRLTIVGEGSSSGVPTATLTHNHASADMISVEVDGCQLKNIKIDAPSQATTGNMIAILTNIDGTILDNIHIDVDQNSDAYAIDMAATANCTYFTGCKFVSTETDATSTNKPFPPVGLSGNLSFLRMDSCIFDGGTVGFEDGSSQNRAFEGSANDVTGIHVEALTLLRGADFAVGSSTVGYINVATATGSSKVIW